MRQIKIKSISGDYKVGFSNDFEKTLEDIKINGSHLLIDRNIWQLYKKKIGNNYLSIRVITPKDSNKNLKEVTKYIEFLLRNNIHKDQTLIVIGGGLIQDIGSFTAHILLRGINWIFVPTTLLAMADSCIGSKSGINVGKYKNQVGSFHPPVSIYIFPEFLKTLPQREFINGIGEILKHALIKGGKNLKDISEQIKDIENIEIAEKLVYESLLIKKEIIEKDELEKNIRKVLNYGHTFGHALEGYTKHEISHGVGVLIGIDIANFISVKKKMLALSEFENIHNLIAQYTKRYHAVIKNYDSYVDFLTHDKKVIGDEVYAILSKGIGNIEIVKIKLDGTLKKYIKEYFEKYAN